MLKRCLHILLVAVVGVVVGLAPAQNAAAAGGVHDTPGAHYSNGRYWRTTCTQYSSQIVRCRTDIWATKVIVVRGSYYTHNAWVFNNLTYLSSPRTLWTNNPLGKPGSWTDSSGRPWRTECDTATTGRNNCSTWVEASVDAIVNGVGVRRKQWVLNNMVRFSTSTIPHVNAIPASAPPISGVPVDKPFVPPAASVVTSGAVMSCKASYYWVPQPTASGERFNPNAYTTAHKSLPFGTRLKVTNKANGRSVVVRVNDRGPYISGRCLDLSRAAMSAIGGTSAGVITVTYQKVA